MIPPTFRYAPESEGRNARLGASEVAAVLGLSRFKTPLEVWESKTGRVGASPDTAVTKRGRYLEDGLLRWLADEVAAEHAIPGAPYTDPMIIGDAPHIGCHPDGFLFRGGEWRTAEVKTARDDREYGDKEDEIPDGYYVQTQIQLYTTGLQVCHFGVYLPMREEFRTFAIERNDAVIAGLVNGAEAWWERHIIGGVPPEAADPSEAARAMFYRYPREKGPMRPATAKEADLIVRLHRVKQDVKTAEAMVEDLAAGVKAAIGEHEGLLLRNGKATWKAQSATRIDPEKLRTDFPSAAAQCSVTSSTRVLRTNIKE